MSGVRYPLAPLAAAMGCSTNTLGERLGVRGSDLQRYTDHGVLHRTADRLAIKAGFHPYLIWPEMHGHDLAETAGYREPTADEIRRREARRRADQAYKARQRERRAA